MPELLDVATNGIILRVRRWPADAPPLVIVHGITNSARGWDFVCRELWSEPSGPGGGFDVYAVDLRGHGNSDKPEHGYATADYAADLVGLIESLKLERPAVLGHSLGARASARLAADRPDLVGRLVLVDPPSESRNAPQVKDTMDAFLAGVRATRTGGIEAARRANPHWSDEQLEARVEGHRQVSDRVMLAPVEAYESGSVLDDLPRIEAPTLFVYGDVNWREGSNRPGVVKPETAAKAGQLLRNGEVVFVSRTGHMVPWDDLSGFLSPVRAFLLGQVTPSRPS